MTVVNVFFILLKGIVLKCFQNFGQIEKAVLSSIRTAKKALWTELTSQRLR